MLDGSDLGVKVKSAKGGKLEYPEKNPWSQTEIEKSAYMQSLALGINPGS